MARKKKVVEVLEDETLSSLKERYFKLLHKEVLGKSKEITTRLDNLEKAILKRKEELSIKTES